MKICTQASRQKTGFQPAQARQLGRRVSQTSIVPKIWKLEIPSYMKWKTIVTWNAQEKGQKFVMSGVGHGGRELKFSSGCIFQFVQRLHQLVMLFFIEPDFNSLGSANFFRFASHSLLFTFVGLLTEKKGVPNSPDWRRKCCPKLIQRN